tara:strand:+ start:188 stop:616 length:429 start_codon:yes stop_codon:yes gene_type:complete
MSFWELLKFGKYYEVETLKHINYDTYEFSIGAFKWWDIKTISDNKETYYEVKTELNCFKYGNILFEFSRRTKPSGIASTTADYWVHYAIIDKALNKYELRIMPVEDIRQMINNKLYSKIVNANNCQCYIFKIDLFNKYKLIV